MPEDSGLRDATSRPAPSAPGGRRWTRWGGLLDRAGFLALFGLVALQWTRLHLLANETSYLVPLMRLAEPELLAEDWTYGGSPLDDLAALFLLLALPLWWAFEDPLHVALCARVLLWVALLAGLRASARALGLGPAAALAALGLAFAGDPDLAAGEWIFGGAEQKAASYAALLFALAALVRGAPGRAGALAGLAGAFHVLVGGWGALALGIAAVADRTRLGLGGVVRFGTLALLVASPVLALAVAYLFAGDGGEAARGGDVAAVMVVLRNPHHLDPGHFLRDRHLWVLPLVFIGSLLGALQLPERAARRVVAPFVGVLVALYLGGLLAHGVGLRRFLLFYPFRVGDVLLPILFWIGIWGGLVPRLLRPGARSRRDLAERVAALGICLGALALVERHLDRLPRQIGRNLDTWTESAREERRRHEAVWTRVRRETDVNAVFAASPCEHAFWLRARRALVASYKATPSNARALEWLDRMRHLNGGRDFEGRGRRLCDDIALHFPTLDRRALATLRDRFGATHYLVRRERPDLAETLVLEESGGWVYRLEGLESADSDPAPAAGSESAGGGGGEACHTGPPGAGGCARAGDPRWPMPRSTESSAARSRPTR